jgi:hypothetical protein
MKFKRINFFNNKKIFRQEYFSENLSFAKVNKIKHFTLMPENIFFRFCIFWLQDIFLEYPVK